MEQERCRVNSREVAGPHETVSVHFSSNSKPEIVNNETAPKNIVRDSFSARCSSN